MEVREAFSTIRATGSPFSFVPHQTLFLHQPVFSLLCSDCLSQIPLAFSPWTPSDSCVCHLKAHH